MTEEVKVDTGGNEEEEGAVEAVGPEEEGSKGARYGRKSLEERMEDVVGDVEDEEDHSTVIGKMERSFGRGGLAGGGRSGEGEEG